MTSRRFPFFRAGAVAADVAGGGGAGIGAGIGAWPSAAEPGPEPPGSCFEQAFRMRDLTRVCGGGSDI